MLSVIDSFSGPHRFLSNFYPSPVVFDEFEYPSVEHAYQAAKTLARAERFYISRLKTPAEAKRAGQRLILREDWDDARVGVMLILLCEKFKPGTPLAEKLAQTGDAKLIEGNTWGDRFWGVCGGEGLNMLGILLMGVRDGNAGGVELAIKMLEIAVLQLTEALYNAGA